MTPVTVAIAQAEVAADLAGGLDKTSRLAREAAAQGAQVVLFPETWLPGYPAWLDSCRDAALWNHPPVKEHFARYASQSVVVDGDAGRALSAMAAAAGLILIVGVTERIEAGPGRGTLYNALLTWGPDGRLLNHHRKLVPTYTERLVWGQGDAAGLRAVATAAGRVGGLICWEHWMPPARQALHESGEDLHAAVWPTAHERHQLASRHYAFEGRCFVLVSGGLMKASALPAGLEPHPDHVRGPADWVLRGGSAVIGPDGDYVLEPVFDEERLLIARLDLDRVRQESMTLDVTGHTSRPDCFEMRVLRGARRPEA